MKKNVPLVSACQRAFVTLVGLVGMAAVVGSGAGCGSGSSSAMPDSGETASATGASSGDNRGNGDGQASGNAASTGAAAGAAGSTGSSGATGTGSTGDTGSTGSSGGAGGSGSAGAMSGTGSTGIPGSTGVTGSTATGSTDGGDLPDAGDDSTTGWADAGDASSGTGSADGNPTGLPHTTLWLVGDSTVAINTTGTALEGWGQEIAQFFISKVTIDNQAQGGRSVQSFMYSDTANTVETAHWASIKANIKAGDFLTVQFGANDSSGIAGRAVTPADFETLLGRMMDEVKAKGATPILVTPSALQIWVNGMETNTRLAPYVAAMVDLGPKKGVLVDDLNARSVAYISSLGQTAAQQVYFNNDKAHFTKYGATLIAQMVTQELRRINSPLGAYVK